MNIITPNISFGKKKKTQAKKQVLNGKKVIKMA